MRNNEFNAAYNRAQHVNVVVDDWFNVCGWWLQLTAAQVRKMYELMLLQGNSEKEDFQGKYLELRNGLRIYKPC